ncbi:hypothetical protein SC1083_1192 [Aggregatibacter actinomycetemcomitans serotype e str. SC1083]|uniref:Uncharacterized protein n=1 Tax=Aggregatibacter actinomycetemcomitans serotype e str. SC1083 TaxID=907488 RepID=G4A8P0_AGGAC|nr:hypothetical protein SC1083_1192 [Aggregatibacter actinomycetemcomitans serotype e str. SC1083]
MREGCELQRIQRKVRWILAKKYGDEKSPLKNAAETNRTLMPDISP